MKAIGYKIKHMAKEFTFISKLILLLIKIFFLFILKLKNYLNYIKHI